MRTLREIQQEIRGIIGQLDEMADEGIISARINIIDTMKEIDIDLHEIVENIEEIL